MRDTRPMDGSSGGLVLTAGLDEAAGGGGDGDAGRCQGVAPQRNGSAQAGSETENGWFCPVIPGTYRSS